MHPNDADGMANSVDQDQTAPIWVYTIRSELSVRKCRNITLVTVSVLTIRSMRRCRCLYSHPETSTQFLETFMSATLQQTLGAVKVQ